MVRIQKSAMVTLLKHSIGFGNVCGFLLSRNARYQEALADQLFNSAKTPCPRAFATRPIWQRRRR